MSTLRRLALNTHLMLAALVSALTGCGTMDNRAGADRVTQDALSSDHLGVIILSTGARAHCISEATFIRIVDEPSGKIVASAPPIAADAYVHKSEFSDHHGTVNAVALPAGNYYLSPSISNPFVVAIKVPNFRFEVRPGETTYVGELFMPQSCGMNTSFTVRDEYERDMRVAIARNSSFGKRVPVKRLLQPVARQPLSGG
jgi:hypothetical protein